MRNFVILSPDDSEEPAVNRPANRRLVPPGIRLVWWRRRELNPRPKKPAVQRLRVYPILVFQRLPKEPARTGNHLARLISALGSGQKPAAYPAK